MEDPFQSLSKIMVSVTSSLDRLSSAIEKRNEMDEALNKCPRCTGDGKDYGGGRCIACAGLGVKQRRADCRASDTDDR